MSGSQLTLQFDNIGSDAEIAEVLVICHFEVILELSSAGTNVLD